MNEENKTTEQQDCPLFFSETLKEIKIPRDVDYSKIQNPIQLKRIQNSLTQIDGYVENLNDVQDHLQQLKEKRSNGKITQVDFQFEKLEICEDTLKNLFEVTALVLNIVENHQKERRKETLPLVNSLLAGLKRLWDKLKEISEEIKSKSVLSKLDSLYTSCVNQLEESKKIIEGTK